MNPERLRLVRNLSIAWDRLRAAWTQDERAHDKAFNNLFRAQCLLDLQGKAFFYTPKRGG